MKELGISPQDYKYLKSDDKSTTLQHKKGHLLTIAHDVLSPKNKAILIALSKTKGNEPQNMAKGGMMEENPGLSHEQAIQMSKEAVSSGMPCLNPNCKSHGKPHPNCRCYSGGESFAKGGKVSHFCSEAREHQPGCEYSKQSMQGMDVRSGNMERAKTEAKGRAEEERYVKPNIKGLAEGGSINSGKQRKDNERGVNQEAHYWSNSDAGISNTGRAVRSSDQHRINIGKSKQVANIQYLQASGKPLKGLAEGGQLNESWNKDKSSMKDSQNKPIPQDSPGMMASEQCFNEGGTAQSNIDPTTGQPDTSRRAIPNQSDAQQAQQGAQQSGMPSSISDVWNNLKNGVSKAEGGEICKACGGSVHRKMYADPKDKISKDDSAPEDNQDDQSGPIELDVGPPQVQPAQPQPIQPQPAQQVPMATNPNIADASANANQASASLYTPEQARKDEAAGMVKDANDFGVDNLSGQIKPKTYSDLFHNKNTFQKLSGLFGILAGGIGSGLTHQPNVALQMMDKVIANDLDAQKTSASNKQNMWNSTYNHMLQEAQTRGLDTNSKLVQQEAAEKANTVSNMYTNQGFLGQMANKVANMPEGPSKEAYKKALYMSAQGIDLKHATLADQLATRMILFDKSGKGWNALQQQNQGQQPQQPKQTPQQPQNKQSPGSNQSKNKYSILSPGADSKYEDIMNDLDPMWSKNKDLVNQQYTQAQQAEKILNGTGKNGSGGLDDVMGQMQDAQKNVGVWGHLHNKMQSSPGLLGEAEGAVAGLVPDTPSEKKYNALKTTLESDLGTALNGIMTPTDIHSAVSKYAPAFQDTPKDVEWKKQQLVNLVRKALRTSALTGAGLVKK